MHSNARRINKSSHIEFSYKDLFLFCQSVGIYRVAVSACRAQAEVEYMYLNCQCLT